MQKNKDYSKDIFQKVGGYDNKIKNGPEDYDLWLRVYFEGYLIKNINHLKNKLNF